MIGSGLIAQMSEARARKGELRGQRRDGFVRPLTLDRPGAAWAPPRASPYRLTRCRMDQQSLPPQLMQEIVGHALQVGGAAPLTSSIRSELKPSRVSFWSRIFLFFFFMASLLCVAPVISQSLVDCASTRSL